MLTDIWTFWTTTYCSAYRNLIFMLESVFCSKIIPLTTLQKDLKSQSNCLSRILSTISKPKYHQKPMASHLITTWQVQYTSWINLADMRKNCTVWENIESKVCQKLIESILQRVEVESEAK